MYALCELLGMGVNGMEFSVFGTDLCFYLYLASLSIKYSSKRIESPKCLFTRDIHITL